MKRTIIAALTAALMLMPATALARHGHKHHRGSKVHRSHGTVGTVTSYDASSGELVITTSRGRELSGLVTSRTNVECYAPTTASTSRHGDDDDNNESDDDNGDDDTQSDDDHAQGDDDHAQGDDDHAQGDDDQGDDDQGDQSDDDHPCSDDNDDNDEADTKADCKALLVPGTTVNRARIDLDGDDAVWTKLKLTAATAR